MPCARQRGERGQDEPQLPYAALIAEELCQRLARPAASRQLGVEGREAGREGGNLPGKRTAAPDWLPLQDCIEGAHTVFSYSIGRPGKDCYLPVFSLRSWA